MGIQMTPLEAWTAKKITGNQSSTLTRGQIEAYQLSKLQETLALVNGKSRFYQKMYANINWHLSCLEDLHKLPFTTSEDIRRTPLEFLCTSQDAIDRIVTLQTSGTTGNPKRLFFTEADQELTIDFFQHGMLNLVNPGDRVLILLPGKIPGSVGDLLRLGLVREGVTGIVHGPVTNPQAALEQIKRERINVLVGIPTQVLALARFKDAGGATTSLRLKSVLLSTDHVPMAIVRELSRIWGCKVFNHYGMTEMGLGGGVECAGLNGYHFRETDLYVEIIDPHTGMPVPEGQYGEVVFTTLTRTGMPLVRYRTGDFSRFIPENCPCGTVLKRLERLRSRDRVDLGGEIWLTMADFDEALFTLDNVLNFTVTVTGTWPAIELRLDIKVAGPVSMHSVDQAITALPGLRSALQQGNLKIISRLTAETMFTSGTAKRQIQDRRGLLNC